MKFSVNVCKSLGIERVSGYALLPLVLTSSRLEVTNEKTTSMAFPFHVNYFFCFFIFYLFLHYIILLCHVPHKFPDPSPPYATLY